jgi:hypothetical protein
MRKQTWQVLFLVAIAVIGLSAIGYNLIPSLVEQEPEDGVVPPTVPEDGEEPIWPGTVYDAATVKYVPQNFFTSSAAAAADTGYMDISLLVGGVWDPLTLTEGFEYDAAGVADESALIYNYGDTIVMHVGNDVQWTKYENETYDRFLYCTLKPGEPVRELSPGIITAVTTNPYTYQITGVGVDTNQDVSYAGGTSPYWGIGAVKLYPRAGYQDVDMYLNGANGIIMHRVTEIKGGPMHETKYVGTFANNGINQTRQNNSTHGGTDYTMTTTTEDFSFELRAGAVNIAFGVPTYAIMASGKFEEYRAVVCLAFNTTLVQGTELLADGWSTVSKPDAYTETIYYRVIDPLIPPTRSKKFPTGRYEITVDSSQMASSTAYSMKVWVLDWQKPSDVAAGALSNGTTTAALPSVYGMVTEYGGDGTVHLWGWSTSSGILLGAQVAGDFTTPS